VSDRLILAVAANAVPSTFQQTQFRPLSESDLLSTIRQAGLWIGPRSALEESPAYRQVIPYVLLAVRGKIIRYTRTSAGLESRLHGRVSVGIGGHVDLSDLIITDNEIDLSATLLKAAEREVREEIGLVKWLARKWIGLVIDNSSAVGRVHIGVVAIWYLPALPSAAPEDALADLSLCSLDEVWGDRMLIEPWSELIVSYLRATVPSPPSRHSCVRPAPCFDATRTQYSIVTKCISGVGVRRHGCTV
jgi:predicted NUDIX family phosphoesterase